MSLTVLSTAYPFAPVGPDAVGGAEQMLAQLDAALVAARATARWWWQAPARRPQASCSRRPRLPVEHGATGFLVRDGAEMADPIAACARPERCRAATRERFGVDRTLRRYFDACERLAGHA